MHRRKRNFIWILGGKRREYKVVCKFQNNLNKKETLMCRNQPCNLVNSSKYCTSQNEDCWFTTIWSDAFGYHSSPFVFLNPFASLPSHSSFAVFMTFWPSQCLTSKTLSPGSSVLLQPYMLPPSPFCACFLIAPLPNTEDWSPFR